jgi:hypothetical protein
MYCSIAGNRDNATALQSCETKRLDLLVAVRL